MRYIEGFGFKIYRLQMAQENCEFLLYDYDKDKFFQFSKGRFKDILKLKIEKIIEKPLSTYLLDQGIIPEDSKNVAKDTYFTIERWINEELELIDNVNYKPINNKIFIEEDFTYFNIYKKAPIFEETKEGNFPNIKKVLMNLVNNDKEAYNYFNSWLAWQIQNPTKRLATSIILQGEQGTGKTLLCNYILREIFGRNYSEINQSDLNKEWNDYMLGKQLIVANEVIYNNTKNSSTDRLKNYVTDKYISVQRRYKDTMNSINYTHWIFTSNNQVPIKIERGDRRYSVFKSSKLENGFEIYKNLSTSNDEVKEYLHYLDNLKVDFDSVNAPYYTEAKYDIIEATSNSVESFFEEISNVGGIDVLNKQYQENQNDQFFNALEYISNSQSDYISLDSLYTLYKKFCYHNGFKGVFGRNSFTSMLKHLNKHLSIIKNDEGKSLRVMKLGGNK